MNIEFKGELWSGNEFELLQHKGGVLSHDV